MSIPAADPARRADLSPPVPEDQRDQLPTQTTQLAKDAFVDDQANNGYWCPNGQSLKYRTQSTDHELVRNNFAIFF